jgi:hypothetical protein
LPDTVPYLGLADSAGNFRMGEMPPGDYLVYGLIDQNGNRLRDPREAFDSVRVKVADSASVELYAFVHDTLPPRIKTVDMTDSLTVRIVFDRLLDPAQSLDTSQVRLAPAADSTATLTLAGVTTPAAFDSARKASAAREDSLRRAAEADSLRRQARADSLRGVAAPKPARPSRPPPLLPAGAGGHGPGRTTPLDTAAAMAMLRRRPAPSDTRIVELTAPLVPGSRYLVRVTGVRSVSGVSGNSQSTLPVPRPQPKPKPKPAAGRAAADTSRAPADTSRATRPDTTRAPAPADTTRPATRDTTKAPAPADTAAPRKPTPP